MLVRGETGLFSGNGKPSDREHKGREGERGAVGGLAGAGWEALALAGMMLTEHGVIEEDPCEPRSESMHRGSLI